MKKHNSSTIFLSGLAIFFGYIILLLLVQAMFNMNITEEITKGIDLFVEEMQGAFMETDVLSDEEKALNIENLESIKSNFKMLMPAMLLIYSMFFALITFVFTKGIFKRLGLEMPAGKFKDFRINEEKRLILLIIIIVVTLGALIDKDHGEVYMLNFTTILVMILQLNALSLIWFKTEDHKKKVPLRILTVVGFVVSAALGSIGLIIRYGLSIVGFMDMHLDFRNRRNHLD